MAGVCHERKKRISPPEGSACEQLPSNDTHMMLSHLMRNNLLAVDMIRHLLFITLQIYGILTTYANPPQPHSVKSRVAFYCNTAKSS